MVWVLTRGGGVDKYQNAFMNPLNQFLLGAGSGMMNQPYTTAPQSAMQGIGAGMQQGMTAFQNAMILQQQQAEAAAKRKEIEEAAAAKMKQQQAFEGLIAGMNPQQQQILSARFTADPKGTLESVQTLLMPPEKEFDETMGDAALDTAIAEYLAQGGKVTDLQNPQVFEAVKKRSDQVRNLNSPPPAGPQGALIGAYGDVVSGRFKKVAEKADQSREMLGVYNQMRGLSGAIESGSVAQPFVTSMQGIAKDFGIPVPDFQPGDTLAAKENFGALNFKLVQEQRKVVRDSQFSSKDMEIYQKSYPSLSQTREGRELMIELQSLDLQKALDDEVWLDDKIAEYQSMGLDGGSAMERALTDLRKEQNARAKSGGGLFVDEDGNPTEVGLRLANLSGKSVEELFGGGSSTPKNTTIKMVRDSNGRLVRASQ